MQITAAMVKELRERTGAGMMDCKKALGESNGDMDAAVELMRKSGQAKADKKASRVAAEGTVVISISDDAKSGVILEVNCETDFVGKDENFLNFSNEIASAALTQNIADIEALKSATLASGETVEVTRLALVSKIGENIQVRRFTKVSSEKGALGQYMHGSRIGVMVEMENGNDDLCKDVAMHIAASSPRYLNSDSVDKSEVEQEKAIARKRLAEQGKPENIMERIRILWNGSN